MNLDRHSKIAHLSEDQLNSLIARYYAGEKTGELLAEYNIDAKPSDLIKLLPPRVLAKYCPYCEVNLLQRYRSKSARSDPSPFCPACEHTEGIRGVCNCKGCRDRRIEVTRSIEDNKRRLINSAYPSPTIWSEPTIERLCNQLKLRDAVYILTLYRNANIDQDGLAGPPYAKERPLAPTDSLRADILKHRASRGLISVSSTSPLDSFSFDDDDTIQPAYYIFKVKYRILPMLPKSLIFEAVKNLQEMAKDGHWMNATLSIDDPAVTEALSLWRELALHEALECFDYQGRLHNLQPPSGEKTILTLTALTADYSVAQIYNIIWSAARDAAAYYQRGGINKAQASNSMVGACRTRAEKAKVEGWSVKPYNRNYQLPRSELSHVLHDLFLKIGEKGFTHTPTSGELDVLPF